MAPAAAAAPSSRAPAARPPAADTAAVDTLTVDLRSTIQRALETSPQVGQRQAERREASARLDEAEASRFLPQFQVTTAHSIAPALDRPGGVSDDRLYLDPSVRNDWTRPRPYNEVQGNLLQPLYTWGQISGSVRAAKAGVAVEEAEQRRTALEVAFRAGETYYGVLLANALRRLARQTGDLVDRAKREVQRLLDEGREGVDEADLFQVRLTEQEYRRRVVEVRQRQQTAYAALSRQLFLDDSTRPEPAAEALTPVRLDVPPDSLAYFQQMARQNRPELAQARAGITARQALVDVEQSNYYPKLFLGADAGWSYAAGRVNPRTPFVSDSYRGGTARAGLGIRLNLNFFQTKARVDQAQARLEAVEQQQTAAEQLVAFEVEDAYRSVITAKTDVASRDSSVQITEEWLRTEQINFDLGFGDTENLVDAVRANLEAEARYYEAVQRYNVAVLRLLRTVGILDQPERFGTLVDFSTL
jgi:outer membrane protein TolC